MTDTSVGPAFAKLVRTIQSHGFEVYQRPPCEDYVYFTDGKNIGYAEISLPHESIDILSVHYPNVNVGTNFQVHSGLTTLTKKLLTDAFKHCPSWVRSSAVSQVIKYNSFEHWHNASAWNRSFVKVEL